MTEAAAIDLSLSALPKYALFSFARGWIAYFFSFLFTVLVASWAFYDKRAHRYILPALDILQSIPVLGFLPGLDLALVALFPHSNAGLELACVLAIFTGQVWNMVFSYYDSLRGTPGDFRMLGKLYNLNWWQRFWRLELPFGAQGLLYNSMVSMAARLVLPERVRGPAAHQRGVPARPGPRLLHPGGDRQRRHPRQDLRDDRHGHRHPRRRQAHLVAARRLVAQVQAGRLRRKPGPEEHRCSSGSPARWPSQAHGYGLADGSATRLVGPAVPPTEATSLVGPAARRSRRRATWAAPSTCSSSGPSSGCLPGEPTASSCCSRPVTLGAWEEIVADTGLQLPARAGSRADRHPLDRSPRGLDRPQPQAVQPAPALHPVCRLVPLPDALPVACRRSSCSCTGPCRWGRCC